MPTWSRLLIWLGIVGVVTAGLWLFRGTVDKTHMALAFLLVVLGGSTRGGRTVGLVLSVVCFLAFNFFLLRPFYSFQIHEPIDWWVLVAFLITGLVAAQNVLSGTTGRCAGREGGSPEEGGPGERRPARERVARSAHPVDFDPGNGLGT